MNLQARCDLELARDSRGTTAIAKIRPYKEDPTIQGGVSGGWAAPQTSTHGWAGK